MRIWGGKQAAYQFEEKDRKTSSCWELVQCFPCKGWVWAGNKVGHLCEGGKEHEHGAPLPLKPLLCEQELELSCKRELMRASHLQLNLEMSRCLNCVIRIQVRMRKGKIFSPLLPVRSRSTICKAAVMLVFGRVPFTLTEVSFNLRDSHHLWPPSFFPSCRIPVSKLSAPLHKGRRWLSVLRPCWTFIV